MKHKVNTGVLFKIGFSGAFGCTLGCTFRCKKMLLNWGSGVVRGRDGVHDDAEEEEKTA